jgi:cleavage and polyadenylation specificity factor subunit 2
MTSYIKFTPLTGARNCDPLAYLLEVDDAKILIDCGASPDFDLAKLAPIKKYFV